MRSAVYSYRIESKGAKASCAKENSEAACAASLECRKAAVVDDSSHAKVTGQQRRDNEKASEFTVQNGNLQKHTTSMSTESARFPTKMLLDLPPEILEMILLALPPDSFSIMLMTCKTIRSAVLQTPKVLRHQLQKIPGLRMPDDTKIDDLLKTFHRRAARAAWNGIDPFADVVVHRANLPEYDNEYWTRPKFNWIQPCCARGGNCDRGLLATAADFGGVIHVYRIRKGRMTPIAKLDPRSLGYDSETSPHLQWRCVATRWQRQDSHADRLVALYTWSLEATVHANRKGAINRFIAEATETARNNCLLVIWRLEEESNNVLLHHQFARPLGHTPILLVTADDKHNNRTTNPVAVIFRKAVNSSVFHIISIFQINGSSCVEVPVRPTEMPADYHGLVMKLGILRAKFTQGPQPDLLLYGWDTAPIDNVARCTTSGLVTLTMATTVSTARGTPKLFTTKASPRSFKGIPLREKHEHECGVYENGSKYCVQTILELVVPRSIKYPGAFLVKYAEEQDSCARLDLNLELPALECTTVAKLLGSEKFGQHIAVSPDGNWIAMSGWNRVKIWGISSDAFLSAKYGSLNVQLRKTWLTKQNKALNHEYSIMDDKAYTINCGQGYFHDHIRIKGADKKRIVGIQPIELPSRGVVFSMAWAKKNILWAWTDQGLVKWAWNKKRTGLREELPLDRVADNIWSYG